LRITHRMLQEDKRVKSALSTGASAIVAGALLAPLVSRCGARAPAYHLKSDVHAVLEGKGTVAANLRLTL